MTQDQGADEPRDLAGEYVLGTLPAAEADDVSARLGQDRALRAAVYAWQDKLLPLSARVSAQQPSSTLWRRIEVALDAAVSANARPARESTAPGRPWWQRLGLWQGIGAVGLAMSLLLGVLLVQQLTAEEAPRYLAVLESPQAAQAGWIVEMQAGGRVRLMPVADGAPVPAGKALQFWTKPEGAAAPTSLGLVQAGQTVDLPATMLPAVESRQLFEITLEPEGGSPIGRPTGPILFVGRSVRVS